MFTVPETSLTAGLIPEYLLDQLATWLRAISQHPQARLAAVQRTILGLLDDLPQQISVLYEALTSQGEVANRLRVQADLAYSGERAALHDAVAAGELIGGTALVEWQSLIGPARVETLLDPASGSRIPGAPAAADRDRRPGLGRHRAGHRAGHARVARHDPGRGGGQGRGAPRGSRRARSPPSWRSGRTGSATWWRAPGCSRTARRTSPTTGSPC